MRYANSTTLPPTPLPLTLSELIARGLLNALIVAYPDQVSATMLLLSVGFPPHMLPPFAAPQAFWLEVCQKISRGATPGASEPLLARAAMDYPKSPQFAPYK